MTRFYRSPRDLFFPAFRLFFALRIIYFFKFKYVCGFSLDYSRSASINLFRTCMPWQCGHLVSGSVSFFVTFLWWTLSLGMQTRYSLCVNLLSLKNCHGFCLPCRSSWRYSGRLTVILPHSLGIPCVSLLIDQCYDVAVFCFCCISCLVHLPDFL